MSFGRLTASILSGTVDTTVALASLNFDFSLVKVEAPSEYKGLGSSLSRFRSNEAEHGTAHITARKLGALFSDVAPVSPNLTKAYGLRASEIAKSSTYNPQGASSHGIFGEQMGADGTTIWAAATSSTTAISVHLLACMLARVWTGPEATSIWVELVAERKRHLASRINGQASLSVASMTASEISLTRDQLAKWDASARAWLLTADSAKETLQRKIMLSVNNIGTLVDGKSSVYSSVLAAWNTAMTVVEGLVSGIPQSIHSGAALLGLASWHLYPDLVVLGGTTKSIEQGDRLIAEGGIATIGLEDTITSGHGIRWSLPLAHFRFYGEPIIVTRAVGLHTAKISIDQFLFVALGSFINTWMSSYTELDSVLEVLLLMIDLLALPTESHFPWLRSLAEPARTFLLSQGEDRREFLQLIKTGCKCYSSFFDYIMDQPHPLLGLLEPNTLLGVCHNDEQKICLLREFAPDFQNDLRSVVIVTTLEYQYRTQFNELISESCFECASVVTDHLQSRGRKRYHSSSEENIQVGHTRWVQLPKDPETAQRRLDVLRASEEDIITVPHGSFAIMNSVFSWTNPPPYMIKMVFERKSRNRQDATASRVEFEFLLGDCQTVALYSFHHIEKENAFDLRHVKSALTHKYLSSEYFKLHLCSSEKIEEVDNNTEISEREDTEETPKTPKAYRSLQALESVMGVYKHMSNCQLSIKVAQRPLYLSHWFIGNNRSLNAREPKPLSLQRTFACIAMFESGSLNLHPRLLNQVMAMSIENSLYVSAPLLSDPINTYALNLVKRVIGNVGKPGIAMMIPPRNPKMRVLPDDSWHSINHRQFDGVQEDCFQHTTLHLSFSEWEMPIDTGTRSNRDSELFFLEAPVALHDRGNWVADLDILGSLSQPRFQTRRNYKFCRCSGSSYKPNIDFASIDCWEELLERPLEQGIVRTHKNWQARLAAVALAVQRGHTIVVLPDDFCWSCYENDANEGHDVLEGIEPSPVSDRKPQPLGLEHYEDDSSDIFNDDRTKDESNVSEPNILFIM